MTNTRSDLKGAGLKVTSPRVQVLDLFQTAPDKHLSAEAVWTALREDNKQASLATVYRVLTQLEGAGLLHRHSFESNTAVFELADDEHHDHMVCTKCGLVVEFKDDVIEKRQYEIAQQHGFDVGAHTHIVYGLCSKCRST